VSAIRVSEDAAGVPVDTHTDPVSGNEQQVVQVLGDLRSLTERMLQRAPAPGYALWLDTTSTTHLFVAEAPSADGEAVASFRGIRVALSGGNLLGKVMVAEAFAWADRAIAAWT
jgi:hypothetical protein